LIAARFVVSSVPAIASRIMTMQRLGRIFPKQPLFLYDHDLIIQTLRSLLGKSFTFIASCLRLLLVFISEAFIPSNIRGCM